MPSDEYKAFQDLDNAVEKGKLVLDFTSDIPIHVSDLGEISSNGHRSFRTKIYDFDKGVTIVKEENKENGVSGARTIHFPGHTSWEYEHEWSVFYVFQDGNLVTEPVKAKELINQATGILLPKVDLTLDFERKKFDGSSDYRIITSPTHGKWPDERFYHPDEQIDEHDLASGANYLKDKVAKLSKETGFSKDKLWPNVLSKELEVSKKQLRPALDKVRGIITEYSGIYKKKYAEEDESMGRIVEAMLKDHQ